MKRFPWLVLALVAFFILIPAVMLIVQPQRTEFWGICLLLGLSVSPVMGIMAIIVWVFFYEKNKDFGYYPMDKYIDIFEGSSIVFMRHNQEDVGLVIANKPNSHLYVYDVNLNGSEVHVDGIKLKEAHLMAGDLTIIKIKKGYRVSWTDEEPWELLSM